MKKILLLGIAVAAALVAVLAVDPPGADRPARPGDEAGPARPGPRPTPAPGEAGTGEISGRVWRAGAPAAARVEAFPLGPGGAAADPTAAIDAGASGAFRLSDLVTGPYELRATAADGAACSTPVRIRHPGERVAVDLTLPSGPYTLRGRAVYEDGRPFRGLVTVDPCGQGEGPSRPAPVETDEEGRFAARWIDAGTVRVRCSTRDGFHYVDRVVRIPFEGELLVVVDRGAVALTGRVTAEDDGSPVGGAEVTVTGDTAENRSCEVRARTGGDGRFSVRVLPIWRTVAVRAEGFSPAERSVEKRVSHVEIRLGRSGAASGRVLAAESRAPLAGVPVLWVPLDPDCLLEGGRTVSGAGGRFSIDGLPNGRVMVWAAGAGRVSAGVGAVSAGGPNPLVVTIEPGAVASVELLAIRAVRVRGRVVDEAGAGVPGVPVRACRRDEGEAWPKFAVGAVSGAGGQFTFDGLCPDRAWYFSASPPGRAAVRSRCFVGAAGEEIEVTLEVPSEDSEPRWLDVSVVEQASGEPVAGAKVSVGRLAGRTAQNGRARLGPLGPGRLSVWVYHPDYALLQNRPIVPETAAGLIPVTVRLRKGLAIAGRVLLPDGRPLENGTVWVEWADADDSAPGRSDIGEVTAGGRFRAGGLLAGRYKIKIGGTWDEGGYWAHATAEAGDEDLVLTTERYVGEEPRTLALRVVDSEGDPVPRAQGEIRYEEGEEGWSDRFEVLDGAASYDLYRDGGSVTISVFGAETLAGARLPLGPALLGPMPFAAGEVTIPLPAERAISGVVRDDAGAGIAGVRLAATPARAEELDFEGEHAVAYSDARGAFRLGGLGEGDYLVSVVAAEEFLPVEPVPTRPGTRDLAIRLARGAVARITVVDPGGEAVPGAAIDVGWDDGRVPSFTRGDGVGVLRGIDADRRLRLTVLPPAGRGDLLEVVREDWRPTDERIELPAGLPVAGVVEDPDGQAAAGAVVRALDAGGKGWFARTARDGTFRFGPCPPGPVRLRALWPDGPDPEWVEVAAGTEDVVLTVTAGRTLTLRILNWADSLGPARARLSFAGGPRWAIVGRDGTATFRGLPAEGDLTVWVGPVGDGLYVRESVPAGASEIAATLVAGGTIEGRLSIPPGAREVTVKVAGAGYSLAGAVGGDGSFCLRGVPPGECVVNARAVLDGRVIRGHAFARPGERVEIVLEADGR